MRRLPVPRYMKRPSFWMIVLVIAAVIVGIVIRNRANHHHEKHIGPAVSATAVCPGQKDWRDMPRDPFYLLFHVENLDLTDRHKRQPLEKALDKLEEGGAAGKVRAGYMLGALPLASYVRNRESGWKVDLTGFKANLAKAAQLKRPFGVYVISNHFQPRTPLVDELLKDPRNRMTYADGTLPEEGYFNANLVSFTLSTDESVPSTRYTFDGMRAIAEALREFDRQHPGLLVGIALNGETHYLFERFYDGTGNFNHPRMTDFSDTAIAEFQQYLDARGVAQKAEAVRDLSFDRFEAGYLPISGWIYDPSGAPEAVEVYVDGQKLVDADYPINRLDAYEDVNRGIPTPNTGFNHALDFSELEQGTHLLQAVARFPNRRVEVGRRIFHLGTRSGETPSGLTLPTITRPADGSLDVPTDDKHLRYAPLARAWMDFRAGRIERYVSRLAELFAEKGFGRERVFSYQLAPWMFGNWNPQLFGVAETFFRIPNVTPGINLYGGNMLNESINRYLDPARGYAIPEAHPQMMNSAEFVEESLRFHYCNGARYISPYFLKLREPEKPDDHDRFRLSPENQSWGSDGFYRAIDEFADE